MISKLIRLKDVVVEGLESMHREKLNARYWSLWSSEPIIPTLCSGSLFSWTNRVITIEAHGRISQRTRLCLFPDRPTSCYCCSGLGMFSSPEVLDHFFIRAVLVDLRIALGVYILGLNEISTYFVPSVEQTWAELSQTCPALKGFRFTERYWADELQGTA